MTRAELLLVPNSKDVSKKLSELIAEKAKDGWKYKECLTAVVTNCFQGPMFSNMLMTQKADTQEVFTTRLFATSSVKLAQEFNRIMEEMEKQNANFVGLATLELSLPHKREVPRIACLALFQK